MQNPWRRAGAKYDAAGRLIVMTVVAAVLAAAAVLPAIGIVGVAARDAANTFNTLPVGTLGTAPSRSVIYDSQGHVITYLYPNNIYRVPVTYNQIAPVMRDAIVAIEDAPFYTQGALDPRGTIRALLHNSAGNGLQGASTLAQQYVKNVRELQAGSNTKALYAAIYPDLRRKIQQLRIAADVEHQMTQHQLLAAYLNVAFYSNHAYGIEVASRVYFSEPPSKLTLPQAALLAGIVQSPSQYNPVAHPGPAKVRRNEVLGRLWKLHYVSKAAAVSAEKTPIVLKMSAAPLNNGCASPQASKVAFFCDYLQHVLEINYPDLWKQINTTGGLAIYTTLNVRDQLAADHSVDSVLPAHNLSLNPGHLADTEVLMTPGTGQVRAIAVDRTFSTQDSIDYAVNTQYGGGIGVQTGSSSKIFTLITALEQGYPLGHQIAIKSPQFVGPYFNCQGQPVNGFLFHNAEGPSSGSQVWQMDLATVISVNIYFAHLEQQVGLCNVVKTAVKMGMTRPDGRSLLKPDKTYGYSADNLPGFTLGEVNVSPMNMAAAYASVAARGWYCSPQALEKIVVLASRKQIPVHKATCYRDMPKGVADAANFILQGVLTVPGATADGRGIGRPAAAKTGTANSGYYAAFAGYTPTLAGYVSVFNPKDPTSPAGQMFGGQACYTDLPQFGGFQCPSQMYGDNAPGATWEETFLRADLGPPIGFVYPPLQYFSMGNGLGAPKTIGGPKKKHGGGGKGIPPPRH
ncbi:MAG: transglycosylase domain-containing protein [Streptosporangiaceae bacterium]